MFRFGEQFKFSVNLDNKFGKVTSQRLEVKAREIVKIPTFELEDMIKHYQELCSQLD